MASVGLVSLLEGFFLFFFCKVVLLLFEVDLLATNFDFSGVDLDFSQVVLEVVFFLEKLLSRLLAFC